jgi:hypothetical protein
VRFELNFNAQPNEPIKERLFAAKLEVGQNILDDWREAIPVSFRALAELLFVRPCLDLYHTHPN